MDDLTTFEWLSKAIGKATRSANFCAVGCLPVLNPGIEFAGLGTIAVPLKRGVATDLIAPCHIVNTR